MDDYALSDSMGMGESIGEPADADDEYAALHDPIRVMAEVLRLVGELRRAADRLGDAIVKAGFPARMWRSRDAWLPDLPGELPEITLDDLLTRLAEFAADAGPHWLREGAEGIERFHEEALILYDVIRPLRSFAQRQRMLPARDRGDHPLWHTLGDPRLATPLDRVANYLRDLDSLAPFIVALAPGDWPAVETTLVRGDAPEAAVEGRPHAEEAPVSAPAAMDGAAAARAAAPAWPTPDPAESVAVVATGATAAASGASEPAGRARRLWDFAPSGQRPAVPRGRRGAGDVTAALGAFVLARRWAVVGVVAALLAMGTGLLTLVAHEQASAPPPKPSYLWASPASLTLTCTGKGSTVSFTLQDTGTKPETWSVKTPAGVKLSAAGGTLKPGASVTLRVTVTTAKAGQGMLTVSDSDGELSVPYTVTCGK